MNPNNNSSIEVSQKSKEIISFFGTEPVFVSAFKKTEKLASAVYMITNLFPETEPMRNVLRQKVTELLSYMIRSKGERDGGKNDFIYGVKTRVLEASSFLEVAYRGGLISEMNFSIINTEFHNLITILEGAQNSQNFSGENAVKNIFESTEKATVPQIPQTTNSVVFANPSTIQKSEIEVSNFNRYSSPTTVKDRPVVSSTNEAFRRTDRQTTILNLIRKKKEVMIKDITEVIKDCSEKTVQRELNSLIASGILKRAGVRRWSKYSLS
ncbi:MAG: DeoR family transcriptional regulator [Patescibacteria group bacterium]